MFGVLDTFIVHLPATTAAVIAFLTYLQSRKIHTLVNSKMTTALITIGSQQEEIQKLQAMVLDLQTRVSKP